MDTEDPWIGSGLRMLPHVLPRVMLVRPYGARVRERVYSLLRRVGLPVDDGIRIPVGTPDAEAIAQIVQAQPEVLVVPFNAHRDSHGERLDGLTLCRLLAQTPDAPAAPVLMAVTQMSAANLQLMTSSGEHAAAHRELLAHRILVLTEDEVDDPDAPARVIAFLRRHGVRPGPPLPPPPDASE